MHTVETVVSFEAAHRLYNVDTYSKECSTSVHGHSYKARIVAGRKELNDAGMVIDFKRFKEIIRDNIERKYDHSLILRECDPLVEKFREVAPEQHLNVVKESPTAEWMAEDFFKEIQSQLNLIDSEVQVMSVSVQETENNIATYLRRCCSEN